MTEKDRLTNPHSHILMNQDILHSGKEEVLWDGVYSKDVLEEMVERLAEYEDTGLSPAEIERLQSELTAYKNTNLTPGQIKKLLSIVGGGMEGVWCERCGDALTVEKIGGEWCIGCFGCEEYTPINELLKVQSENTRLKVLADNQCDDCACEIANERDKLKTERDKAVEDLENATKQDYLCAVVHYNKYGSRYSFALPSQWNELKFDSYEDYQAFQMQLVFLIGAARNKYEQGMKEIRELRGMKE